MKRIRIRSFLLAMALILSLLPTESLAAAPTVSVEAALQGDTVTATVHLSAYSGITSGHVVLAYDPDILTPAEAQTGPLLTGGVSDINTDSAGNVSLAFVGNSPLTQDGVLMILRFQVSGKIPGAGTALTLTVHEIYAGGLDITARTAATGASLFSAPAVLLEATYLSAKVTVKVYLAGALHVTDGKILLTYDSTRLCFTFCTAAAVGMVSVSGAATEDRISIAWADSDLSNKKTLLATLEFSMISGIAGEIAVTFDPVVSTLGISGTDITDTAYAEPLALTLPGVSVTGGPLDAGEAEPAGFENPYIDVNGHWACKEILTVTKAGLLFGRTANTFMPDEKITRAEFITVLWRMSGKPAILSAASFDDVSADSWFGAAVVWAEENGVANGVSEDQFAPNAGITREMMATMLCRYAALTGRDAVAAGDLNVFSDSAEVSSWALASLRWAVADGIISGSGGKLLPKDSATRAQTAAILYRYSEL